MMKKLDKYKYVTGKQITGDESRIYDIAGHRLPSVTTILDKTKDKSFSCVCIGLKSPEFIKFIHRLSKFRLSKSSFGSKL